MRQLSISLFALLLLTLVACNRENLSDEHLSSDEDLIAAIQNADDRVSVQVSDLPSTAQDAVNQESVERAHEDSYLAADLGYEVNMRGRGGNLERRSMYFDLDGRRLRTEGGNREGGERNREGDRNEDRDENGDRDRECHDDCLEYVYPLTFTMPDGSSLTVTSEDDTTIWAWYAANPSYTDEEELQYPFTVILPDGNTVVIDNDTTYRRALGACNRECDEEEEERCFEFVYPLTMIMPDGSTITGHDGETLGDDIAAWYSANPSSTDRPTLQFPLDVMQDAQTITVNSERELEQLCN